MTCRAARTARGPADQDRPVRLAAMGKRTLANIILSFHVIPRAFTTALSRAFCEATLDFVDSSTPLYLPLLPPPSAVVNPDFSLLYSTTVTVRYRFYVQVHVRYTEVDLKLKKKKKRLPPPLRVPRWRRR
jgi:hypothetical protein